MDCVKCFGTGLVDGAIYCNCRHGKDLNKKVIEKFTGVKTKVTGRTTIDIEKDGEVVESLEVVFSKKEPPFKVDDWVELRGKERNPSIIRGYVIKIDEYSEKCFVQAVWSNTNKFMYCSWCNWDNLTNLPQETDPDILIDLALATKDEEWFTQLTRGME